MSNLAESGKTVGFYLHLVMVILSAFKDKPPSHCPGSSSTRLMVYVSLFLMRFLICKSLWIKATGTGVFKLLNFKIFLFYYIFNQMQTWLV